MITQKPPPKFSQVALIERRKQLSSQKQALLRKHMRTRAKAPRKQLIPNRPNPSAPAPLSPLQERMWFLYEWDPQGPSYNEIELISIAGPFDLDAMEHTQQSIVQRHEILRTTYRVIDGEPMQIVHNELDWQLKLIDLSALPEADIAASLQEIAQTEADKPFDLQREFPWRMLVVRLAAERHALICTNHHITSDGWSIVVRNSEFSTLYSAYASGRPAFLPHLPLQYADYAVWQRERLQGDFYEKLRSYWVNQLAELTTLQLPTDRTRPATAGANGGILRTVLPLELVAPMQQFSQDAQVTEFMIGLALLNILLHRYANQDDIVVGTQIASRNRPELEPLIGFFAETLVLRNDLSGNPSFRELMQRVQKTTLDAYAHQEMPFGRLVNELGGKRDLSRTPLFQVMFIWQDWEQVSENRNDSKDGLLLDMDRLDASVSAAKFDLALSMEKQTDGFHCRWEFNSDLFDQTTIERMAQHLQELMQDALHNPDKPIDQLNILAADEYDEMVFGWNDTQADMPDCAGIQELFEAQAGAQPDAVAVECGADRLTYDELNCRANQLAHALVGFGIRPKTPIGICLDGSVDMIVSILAILKASCVYVPIDTASPLERIEWILTDSEMPLILTHATVSAELPSEGIKLFQLDTETEQLLQLPTDAPSHNLSPDDPAYIIYTSGSTGKPKGVVVSHRNIIQSTVARWTYFGPSIKSDFMLTSFAFDASTSMIFWMLISGGRLILPSADFALTVDNVLSAVATKQPLSLNTTPALYRHILNALDPQQVKSLRVAITGGESPDVSMLDMHHSKLPDVGYYNEYGPTECTVWASVFDCSNGSIGGRIPIGKPIQNAKLYILDRYHQPVPIGCLGELFIGGDIVATGYYRREALTAERFIPNPFLPEEDGRIYGTGDLCYHLPDGNVVFVGRADQQVKIRGFRIELAEIELALMQQPAVKEAVVIVWETEGVKRLVAYVSAQSDVSDGEIRAFLQRQLPEYMVPAIYMRVAEFPLTVNDKIDRDALPLPTTSQSILGGEYVAPRTEQERQMVSVWEEVLKLERIGIDDNFFDMGGDSLLSLRIMAKAREFGSEVTLQQLFQYQTIRELLENHIDGAVQNNAEQGIVTGPAPLLNNQQRFFRNNLDEPNWGNLAVIVSAQESLDSDLIKQAALQIAHHHDALRARFSYDDQGWHQQISEPSEDDAQVVSGHDLSKFDEAAQKQEIGRISAEVQQRFDLAAGRLWRIDYFDCGELQLGQMLITVHHLVADAVSFQVLLDDLNTAYTQLAAGEGVVLPRKTTSLKRWGELLEAYEDSVEFAARVANWRTLAWDQIAPLPLDFPDGLTENTRGKVSSISTQLSAEETLTLRQKLPQLYQARMMDALMLAFTEAITNWSGNQHLGIQMVDSGRNMALSLDEPVDVSRTVGWLSLTSVLLLTASDGAHIEDRLADIVQQRQATSAYGIPINWLKHVGGISAEIERNAQQVKFNYIGHSVDVGKDVTLFSASDIQLVDDARHNQSEQRDHLIDCQIHIENDQLHMNWSYHTSIHVRQTVEMLARTFQTVLNNLIESAATREAEMQGEYDSDTHAGVTEADRS